MDLDGDARDDCWSLTSDGGSGFGGTTVEVLPGCGSQAFTLELALRVLESAPAARTTVQSPLRWAEDAAWKRDYNNVALMSADDLARRRAEFDAQKAIAKTVSSAA